MTQIVSPRRSPLDQGTSHLKKNYPVPTKSSQT